MVEFDEETRREALKRLNQIIANFQIRGEHYKVKRIEKLKEHFQR